MSDGVSWSVPLVRMLALTVSLSFAAGSLGATNEERGLEVATAAKARESGYVDLMVDMSMVLKDRNGRQVLRQINIRQIEAEGDGDCSLLIIRAPKAIRGTALLSHAHLAREDDQWVFLPAVNRVKKVASRNKSGPFLGSDFAYEDLISQELEKYAYKLAGEDLLNGVPQWIVERVPIDSFSGYSRQLVWYNKLEDRIERIEYYDKHGLISKVLLLTDFRLYEDRYWKAQKMLMSNVQTGKSTELVWSEFQFGNGFSVTREFSTNSLRRAR